MHLLNRKISAVFLLFLFSAAAPFFLQADPNDPLRLADYPNLIRVTCVGDSITAGIRTRIMRLDSYPSQLQRMLGTKWLVNNFGVMSKTLLKEGDQPYQQTRAFQEALKSDPDVVIIALGTNDAKDQNWKFKEAFISDYKNLIDQFKALPSHPRIFICHPPPLPKVEKPSIPPEPIDEEIPMVDSIAKDESVGGIDLHTPLLDHMNLIVDGIHPGTEGAYVLAKTVYHALTGTDFTGQLNPCLHSDWKGYDRIEFAIGNRVGSLVQPKNPAPGHPWAWRSESLDLDSGLDVALLEKGWFIAGAETAGSFGSPSELSSMDEFYNFVVKNDQLSTKPVLKGYGGGGLAAMNWAARHPDRVGSIYLDGAVLDFKSYPGGKEKGKNSPRECDNLKKDYKFADDAAALVYAQNPIDNLQALANAKIAIFGVSGAANLAVPCDENISQAEQRYKAMGGEIQVVLVPGQDERISGLKDPTPVVDFILKHTPSTP